MRSFRAVGLSAVVLMGSLAASNPAAAADRRGGQRPSRDNVVSVENHKDRHLLVRSRAQVAHERGTTVSNQNVGSAYASCTDCRTVAAAVQVVIVETEPTDFRPVNLAGAVNEHCVRCETFAYARQIVLQPANRVSLSRDAEGEMDDIGEEIRAAARSPRAFDEMTVELDALAEELADVVRAEIVRSGTTADEVDRRSVDDD